MFPALFCKDDNIGKVTITREYIEGTGGPIIDIRTNLGVEEKDYHTLNEIPLEHTK